MSCLNVSGKINTSNNAGRFKALKWDVNVYTFFAFAFLYFQHFKKAMRIKFMVFDTVVTAYNPFYVVTVFTI